MTKYTSNNNLDLIRLIAATQVAVKHILIHLGIDEHYVEILNVFPGVPIFFLLSGFLIFQSFNNSKSLPDFFINRFLRIYPALVVCFVFTVSLILLSGYLTFSSLAQPNFLSWVAAQLTIVQFYNPDFLRSYGTGVANGSLWTISIELQFYILTPILFYITRRSPLLWAFLICIFIAVSQVARLFADNSMVWKFFYVSFIPWIYMFILGAWLSTRPDIIEFIRQRSLFTVLFAYFLVETIAYYLHFPIVGNEINTISFLFLSALIFKLAYYKPNFSSAILGKNDISYGIYIYHMPIVNYMIFKSWTGSVAYAMACIVAVYAIALLSWHIVERPALKLKRKSLRAV